jgi:two-component system OmpR family response regulator
MRILIVEDEVTLAQALRRGLNIAGYSVDVAHDGNEALFQARVHDYDAIVLDLMLPEVDGLSVCETLRKEGRWMPVLMLTARDGVGDTVRGLDVGADDYLVKPFDFSELLARLRALVRRGASERPPVMQIGDLTIDPARRTVERAGRSIDLTPREFALVEYLARHSGQVVSRTRLLEHVWDGFYDGLSNVVDVHVANLRRKIDAPFDQRLLRTVRGVGYVLEEPR